MDRVVLVTGASGGIGGAVARAFAARGDRVALGCHQSPGAAGALCEELRRQGAEAMAVRADVANEGQVEAMFRQVEEQLGEVEVLVNGAGFARQKLFTQLTLADWQAMFEVHVQGSFLCCRRALGPMLRKKKGSIVNVSSVWGQVGASCEVDYSAAKAAVIGLTKALAKEVGPSGVRVNCVAPGGVETAMMDGFSPADKAAFCEDVPLGRLGTPREVAEAVVFLAGEEASYLTGQVLAPNGGMV